MTAYAKHFQIRETPQSQPIPGTDQAENSAGGYSWAVNDWMRLDRFLILGCEGGSYYASEKKLAIENAEAVLRCVKADGRRTVERIIEISEAGRAPKNDPAIFALAMASSMGDVETKKIALDALSRVARIGTHLFRFIEEVKGFRGWGRALRRAVANWYTSKTPDALAYQILKYQNRNDWTHRDLIRKSHPVGDNFHNALFRYIASPNNLEARTIIRKDGGREKEFSYPDVSPETNLPPLIESYKQIQAAKTIPTAVRILRENPSVSWEMIPTEFLGKAEIWEALLPNLPMTAMIRNLARMTANGLIAPLSAAASLISGRLKDKERIRKARVHPIAILGALATYRQGHGAKGRLAWNPVDEVLDALDQAFYLSFDNVEPTGKRWCLALDVSESMTCGEIAGMSGLTPRVASAAMALITACTEKSHVFVGFSSTMIPLNISPRQRLDDVIKTIEKLPYGGTDCALPMLWALQNKIEVDVFIVYTDSETWCGNIHPIQALQEYRRKTGIPARLIVVGMIANDFSIADPNDAGMLDVVGFDTATPAMISDFAR